MEKKRDSIIDIIKGMAIFLVVYAHSCSFGEDVIILFHMPLFFILAGYTFQDRHSDSFSSLIQFAKRRIKTLWLPFFLSNSIFLALNNVFMKISFYTDNEDILAYCKDNPIHSLISFYDVIKGILKGVFFLGLTEVGGTAWFLRALFNVIIVFAGVDFVIKRLFNEKKRYLIHGILSVVFLCAGYFLSREKLDYHGHSLVIINYVLNFYILLFGGYLICNYFNRKVHLSNSWKIVLAFVSLAVLNICHLIPRERDIARGRIPNPFYYLLVSVAGWILMYEIAYFINKGTVIKKFLVVVGQNTLAIMLLHFLVFKFVNAAVVAEYNLPLYVRAAFPTYNMGKWYLSGSYLMAGFLIPLFISIGVKKLKLDMLNKGTIK